jgi:hypothetical protein
MDIIKLFDKPLSPEKSIQLNNKYWPFLKFTNLNLIQDCELEILSGSRKGGACYRNLMKLFPNEELFRKMLKRLGKILSFQSNFGCAVLDYRVNIASLDLKNHEGDEKYFWQFISKNILFKKISYEVRKRYRLEYGWDITRLHKSVRYARGEDGYQSCMTNFGRTSDFHNDEYKGITCIVYLSDVKKDNGAFTYIHGSEKIIRSPLLTAIHQTVSFDMKLSHWDQMGSLPLEFRATHNIGNFLEPDKAKALLAKEVVLEDVAGTVFMFNGQKLIHRGGKPLKGSRLAAFLTPEGLFIHKLRSFLATKRY